MLKTSNPYGANDSFKTPEQIVSNERTIASGKAGQRFVHKPLGPGQNIGSGGGGPKKRAFTPGGPAGS